MRDAPGRGAGWRAFRAAPAVTVLATLVVLAAASLLAGCQGTPAGSLPGAGRSGAPGSGGNGGNGGDGYGGWGGNGYGGNGGDADGVDGAPGATDAAVAGSGRLTSRTIDLSGVTSVVVDATFVVHLRTGGPAHAVVQMDDNLTDVLDTTVNGEQLHLGIKPGKSIRDATLSAEVTVSQLDRLASGGASRVILVPALTGPALQLVVSGASSVTGDVRVGQAVAEVSGAGTLALTGLAEDLRLRAAGGSQLPLTELRVRRLDATLSGASHTLVTVSDTLAVRASGASVLRYRGTGRVTRSQTSGMASVVQDSP
ncbi:MAG TPA: DUF2807 domain-containing protein [Pseudonocardiaceae bacterium]|nr:DUF2807 domain-containing protein [Pseudonocardiaceae bacterium]